MKFYNIDKCKFVKVRRQNMWLHRIEEKILMIPIIIKTFFLNIRSKENKVKTYK